MGFTSKTLKNALQANKLEVKMGGYTRPLSVDHEYGTNRYIKLENEIQAALRKRIDYHRINSPVIKPRRFMEWLKDIFK